MRQARDAGTKMLVSAAVSGLVAGLACRGATTSPPTAPVEPASSSSTAPPHVVGAPRYVPGTAHPPMRARWSDTQHDDDCKNDPKSGLPCPPQGLERQCCAGKNDCKGQSGCRSSASACSGQGACAGQNECKGKGTSCPPTPAVP